MSERGKDLMLAKTEARFLSPVKVNSSADLYLKVHLTKQKSNYFFSEGEALISGSHALEKVAGWKGVGVVLP